MPNLYLYDDEQSLGEGVFAGLPLAIAAVRAILERMDWGSSLTVDQLPPRPGKGAGGAIVVEKSGTKPEDQSARSANDEIKQMIRLGAIGRGEIKSDDDIVMIIAPQNSKLESNTQYLSSSYFVLYFCST